MTPAWKRYLLMLSVSLSLPVLAQNTFSSAVQVEKAPPASVKHWNDEKAEMDSFISDLIARMTLKEKIGQLDLQSGGHAVTGSVLNDDYMQQLREGRVGSVFNAYGAEFTRELQRIAVEDTRLGIPLLIGLDVIHGHKTIFPQSIGEAASWDLETVRNGARVAAREAAAEGINWTFAPMADIARDPRWGRVAESAGEDPYLSTAMAVARVQGFQGDDLSQPDTIMATAKHFVGYGLAQGGRDYNTTDVSEHELWTTQMPAFKAMVDAGVATFMTAFNDLNGIPATGNKTLLTDILRDQWGFEGFVVTDYTAINELVPHGFARNEKHAAELAFNAGADMDMVGRVYINYLEELVEEGKVDIAKIDHSVRLILEMKWRLGLFEDPYRYSDIEREEKEILSQQNLESARDAARKSFVLLKNDNQTLPLNEKKIDSIALIGPLADSKRDTIGNWVIAGDGRDQPITIKEGLEARLGNKVEINYAEGATSAYLVDEETMATHGGKTVSFVLEDDSSLKSNIQDAIEAAKKSDVIVMALGEEQRMSGEASSRVELTLPGNQQRLMEELKKLDKPMILVLLSGRPNDLQWADKNVDAILHAWYPGTQGGLAIADVLMGDYSPSGKLPMTFPRSVGQVPLFYNQKSTGRPYDASNPNQRQEHYTSRYDDSANTPLYAFGHGLSYTDFTYGKIKLSSNTLTMDGEIEVAVKVTNSGDSAGEEVVQLYTRQLVGSITRPVKELKGFQKLHFEKGESKEVKFTLTAEDLAFYRAGLNWGSEAGDFYVYVGTASDNVQKAEFKLIDK
ncbi:beta-glucosidase BglX [Photobacterium sagamiensis]|uniref:beta-glucosidase BglX n=1 Tax=Photobacterium sagamiensis TaxID=2910241 RepID=UPI003D13AC03